MSDIHRKRLGRTLHAIQLLAYYNLTPSQEGVVLPPGMLPNSIEAEGFIEARNTFFKSTIRNIFRLDQTTNTYRINKRAFSVHSLHGNLHVPGGVMTSISLASFPYQTVLIIYNANGTINQHISMAGNPAL